MLIFLQLNWLMAFVCMSSFYIMGKQEARSGMGRDIGLFWSAVSLALSAITISVFGGGWVMVVFVQVGFFFSIGVVRATISK